MRIAVCAGLSLICLSCMTAPVLSPAGQGVREYMEAGQVAFCAAKGDIRATESLPGNFQIYFETLGGNADRQGALRVQALNSVAAAGGNSFLMRGADIDPYGRLSIFGRAYLCSAKDLAKATESQKPNVMADSVAPAVPAYRLYRGRRGGCYYLSGNRKKVYVDRSECSAQGI